MYTLNNDEFNAKVARLIALPHGKERKRLTDEVFTDLIESGTARKWSKKVADKSNYRDMTGREDLAQTILEKLVASMNSRTTENSGKVQDWLGFLYGVAVNAAKMYLSSGQVTPASGMSGITRRRAIIIRTHGELLKELQREPTMQEIIERANTWAVSKHKDAHRQGLILSERDFSSVVTGTDAVDDDELERTHAVHHDSADERAEARLALRRMREATTSLFPGNDDLLLVVNAWCQDILDGERPMQARLSRATGLPVPVVRDCMTMLNSVLEYLRAAQVA